MVYPRRYGVSLDRPPVNDESLWHTPTGVGRACSAVPCRSTQAVIPPQVRGEHLLGDQPLAQLRYTPAGTGRAIPSGDVPHPLWHTPVGTGRAFRPAYGSVLEQRRYTPVLTGLASRRSLQMLCRRVYPRTYGAILRSPVPTAVMIGIPPYYGAIPCCRIDNIIHFTPGVPRLCGEGLDCLLDAERKFARRNCKFLWVVLPLIEGGLADGVVPAM